MKKRVLSLLLAVALVLSVAPTGLFTPASAAVTLLTTSTSAQYHLKRMMIAHGDYGDNADGYQIQVTGTVNLAQSFSASTIKGWTGTLSNAPAWNDTVAQELMDNYMRQEADGKYSFAYVFPAKVVKMNVNSGFTATYYFWSDTPTTHVVSGGGTIVFKLRDSGALANAVNYMASGNLTNKAVANSQQFVMTVNDGDFGTDVVLPTNVKLTVPSGITMKADNLALAADATAPGNIDGAGDIWVTGTVTNPENISGPTVFKYVTTAEEFTAALKDASFGGVVLGNNIEVDEDIVIPADKTIDFNGNILTGESYSCAGTERNRESNSVSASVSPNVGSAGDLNNAIDAGLTEITLTGDISFNDVLEIPEGTTLDLNGHNLYVTGLIIEEGGTLTKNGGKLWANVSTAATLTAEPTAASVSNLWAANEVLLAVDSDFDGIRLEGDLAATANVYATGTNDEILAWMQTNLPNLYAADALSIKFNDGTNYLKYGIVSIPEGKTLDLNGKTLTLRAIRPTLGAGDVIANGGAIKLWYNCTTSSIANQSLKSASGIAAERPGIVTAFNQTGSAVQYNNYPIPSGVALSMSGTASVTSGHVITFMVANEADFTRRGTELEAAKQFKLERNITLTADVDVGAADVDYDSYTVTGGLILTTGEERNKPVEKNEVEVASVEDFTEALTTATKITLTADIYYDDVLTIPAYMEIDLNGHKLYITGLTNKGTITKNGGTLWANVSTNTAITATASAANVSNYWAANEELLRPDTEFDGIRLTAYLSTANAAGTATNVPNYLPNLYATGAYITSSNNCYFVPQIPAGKTLDLNGRAINFYATADNIGAGTVIDSAGTAGRIRMMYNDSLSRGTYANALAIAATRPTQKIFRFQQSGTLDYTGLDPIPANAFLTVIGDAASNVTFLVDDQAGLTREGTGNDKVVGVTLKLVKDIELAADVDVGANNVDYDNHQVVGGKIITTGTEYNKPAVVVNPEVGTKIALQAAIEAELEEIKLTADIDYNAVLNIPAGTTLNLDGHELYVTGFVNNGTLEKNEGKLWANVSAIATLTAEPTMADVSNLYAAQEVLWQPETEFDGVRLMADVSEAGKRAVEDAQWREICMPNFTAAGGFTTNTGLQYATFLIPAGKTLDLNGHIFMMYAGSNYNDVGGTTSNSATFGEGTIEANGGSITLLYYATSGSVPSLRGAWQLAKQTDAIGQFRQTSSTVDYTSYFIPAGVTLTKVSGTFKENTVITFMVADQSDFTRTGTELTDVAKAFRLANDITLTGDVNIGDANIDYQHHTVTGGKIITTGVELNAPSPIVASGECGDNLTWTLENTGVLTISGTGAMDMYPWMNYANSILSVVIEEGVTSIVDHAFFGCPNLLSISIPASVTEIGNGVIAGCDNLQTVELAAGNTAFCMVDGVLYNAAMTELLYYPISKTGAFTVPSSVVTIRKKAFYGTMLTTITVPDSVTTIGEYAFCDSKMLQAIMLGNGITVIKDGAFYANEPVDVYYNGTQAQWNAILYCDYTGCTTPIGELNFDLGVIMHFVEQPAAYTLGDINSDGSINTVDASLALMFYVDAASNPLDETQQLAADVDKNGAVNTVDANVILMHYVGTCGADCPLHGEPVVLPEVIASGECGDNLAWTLDENGLLTVSGTGDMTDYSSAVFVPWYSDRAKVKTVVIGDGVTSIGDCAFGICNALTSITIPDSVTSIGACAFEGCGTLTEIVIPASVTEIGPFAFNLTSATVSLSPENTAFEFVDGVLFTEDGTVLVWYPPEREGTTYTVPDGVTVLRSGAFANVNLASITLSASVKGLYDKTFFGSCVALTEINVAEDNTCFCSVDGVLYNKNKTSLLHYPQGRAGVYEILPGVTRIFGCAFGHAKQLTQVTIPASVTTIDSYAFNYCNALTDVYYGGTQEQWNAITIGSNEKLTGATIHVVTPHTAGGGSGSPSTVKVPTTWAEFQALSSAEKYQLEQQLGEDQYSALVAQLQGAAHDGAVDINEGGSELP